MEANRVKAWFAGLSTSALLIIAWVMVLGSAGGFLVVKGYPDGLSTRAAAMSPIVARPLKTGHEKLKAIRLRPSDFRPPKPAAADQPPAAEVAPAPRPSSKDPGKSRPRTSSKKQKKVKKAKKKPAGKDKKKKKKDRKDRPEEGPDSNGKGLENIDLGNDKLNEVPKKLDKAVEDLDLGSKGRKLVKDLDDKVTRKVSKKLADQAEKATEPVFKVLDALK